MIIPSSLYGDFPVSVSASLSHKDHSVCSLHSLATMLGDYQRIYGLSVDQICPFELACSFRHDVRHLEFVNPEDTGFEIKKDRRKKLREGRVKAEFESHGSSLPLYAKK